MEKRKHKRITSGVEGSTCIICKDETAFTNSQFGLPYGPQHDRILANRHTVIKDEPHMWQNSDGSSPSPDRCEHCGHGKVYPMHRDFDGYDDMLVAFKAAQAADARKYEEELNRSMSYISPSVESDIKYARKSAKDAASWFWICVLIGLGVGGIGGSLITAAIAG